MSATARRSDRINRIGVHDSRQTPWWPTCLLLAVLTAPVAARASEPKIVVSPLIRAEASTELDFYVHVDSINPVPTGSTIIITGLPKAVTLSAGSAIATGIWEVPLLALDRLRMVVPASEASRSHLLLYLAIMQKDRLVILASAPSVLVVEAPTEVGMADAMRAKEARKAEEARGDARRQAAAKKAEEERLAEAMRVEKARIAEAARAEACCASSDDLVVPPVRRLMDDHPTVSAHRMIARLQAGAEEARKAEEARAEDGRRQAAAKKAEEERLAEAKRVEEARKAEEARVEDARRQAAAKKAEEERLAEAKRVEEARKAEEVRVEDARRQAEAKKAEEERLAEAKRVEEARKAEEVRAEDGRRQAAAKKAEEERLAEAKRVEKARIAEAAIQDARRQAGVARADASPPTVAALSAEQAAASSEQYTPTFAQLERLVERGDRYLDQGNILVARQYFLRAAQGGLGAAAFKLAETHDPHELVRLNVQGLMPDPAEAKRWYTRASDLGTSEAKARLGRLGD